MESAIKDLVKVYLKSTKGKESLRKNQFQDLVKSQLSNILSDTDSKEAINNMATGLDADQDGKVGFEEYLKLVGYLACSVSEQRALAKDEPANNTVSEQVVQSEPAKEEEKPAANAEVKEEPKAEANEEPKVEAAAEVKAEECSAGKVVTVEIKSEGETQPEAAKEEEKPNATVVLPGATVVVPAATVVPAALEEAAATAEVAVIENEEVVKAEIEKVEDAAEKLAAAVEEEVEKKIDEATS